MILNNTTVTTTATTTATTTTLSVNSTAVCELTVDRLVLTSLYFVLFLVGTIGNILVIVSFLNKQTKKRSTLDLLILYLAFFDLLASIVTPLIFGYWSWTCNLTWHFGWFACKTLPVTTRLFTSVSCGILLIMAIDRFRTIVKPLRPRFELCHIHMAVMAVIVLSFASEVHYVKALYITTDGQCGVLGTTIYVYMSIAVMLFRDMTFIFVFTCTTVGVVMRLYGKSAREMSRSQSNSHVRQRQKRKAVKMMIVMATVFGLCIMPRDLYQTSLIVHLIIDNTSNYSSEVLLVNSILKILQTSNSIYNVFIYAGMSNSFGRNIIHRRSRGNRKNLSHQSNDFESPQRKMHTPVSPYKDISDGETFVKLSHLNTKIDQN